jgi:hypothetical protein
MHESQQHSSVETPAHLNSRTASGSWRGSYAEWIAVGAVIAGSVGALVGARHHSRRSARTTPSEGLDPETVTAPHGDKLEAVLR